MTTASGVTPVELAHVMVDRGKPIKVNTIRWHCSSRTGLLFGKAEQVGRSWIIPAAAADEFAAWWEPYRTLRKRQQ